MPYLLILEKQQNLNPGPLSFGLVPNHFVLGAQLASGEKRLVCIPEYQQATKVTSSKETAKLT